MKGLLFDNLGWKLLCVVMAFSLWVVYSGNQELTTSITAPVQYRNIPASLDISSDIVENVHLHLRGPSSELARMSSSGLPIVIDLSQTRAPGERTVNIEPASLRLPAGVTLARAIPSQIRVKLESRLSRKVPVLARFQAVPAGMQVVHVESNPAELDIAGPESRVERIAHVETDPVDLNGAAAGEMQMKATVFAGDPQVSFVSHPVVTVKFKLAPKSK